MLRSSRNIYRTSGGSKPRLCRRLACPVPVTTAGRFPLGEPLRKASRRQASRGGVSADQDVPVTFQSAMLVFGPRPAWQGDLTAGAITVSPTLMGRGLALIEMAVGQWAVAQRANEAWHRLSELRARVMQSIPRTTLAHPRILLAVESLSVGPPRRQVAPCAWPASLWSPGRRSE